MLKRNEIIERIIKLGIIAVVRTDSPIKAEKIAEACIAGGIDTIEITFSVPEADRVILELRKRFADEELLLGAGTVLDPETARIAQLAGARYIVAPNFNKHTATVCNRYQCPYIPGCMTITEMVQALEAGSEIIKLFPADIYSPSIIKSINGPLPQILLMPTGGITLDTAGDWIKQGATALGIGGGLTKVVNEDYSIITERCKELVRIVNEARSVR